MIIHWLLVLLILDFGVMIVNHLCRVTSSVVLSIKCLLNMENIIPLLEPVILINKDVNIIKENVQLNVQNVMKYFHVGSAMMKLKIINQLILKIIIN